MKKILLVAITALFLVSNAFAQVRQYNIISNGNIVGTLTATQAIGSAPNPNNTSGDAANNPLGPDQKVVKVESHFDVHMFITVHVKYIMHCEYLNGKLVKSSVETYKDDDLHSSSKGSSVNGEYVTTEDGDESTYKGTIAYSGAMLYFNEPRGIQKVFSEIHAVAKPIEKVADNQYKIVDPETGHTNQYYYQGGILQKAMIDHSLFSFTMELIK